MWRILLSLICAVSVLHAQNPPTQPSTDAPLVSALPIFRATLPGGTYEVAVRSIVSVSSHEYVVDAAARVTEVNIDTAGNVLARFYYLEPNTPSPPAGAGQAIIDKAQELLKQGAAKGNLETWKKVVKNYPTTTHAHTVEYRIETKEELLKLFNAAEESFRMQRTKQISIP